MTPIKASAQAQSVSAIRRVSKPPSAAWAGRLTDAGDHEQDEEGVEDGLDGGRERRDDLLERLDPPKDPDHPSGGGRMD